LIRNIERPVPASVFLNMGARKHPPPFYEDLKNGSDPSFMLETLDILRLQAQVIHVSSYRSERGFKTCCEKESA